MFNKEGQAAGIVHCVRNRVVGQKGNKLVDGPGVRDRRDEVLANQVKTEAGGPGAVGKKVRGRLRGPEAEAAARRGARLAEAKVIAEVVVSSNEANTPA